MLTKSKRPRTAHCATTFAPSCSTSWFTSRIRDGLFLTVCTPSGVSVLSITYVGKEAPPIPIPSRGREVYHPGGPPRYSRALAPAGFSLPRRWSPAGRARHVGRGHARRRQVLLLQQQPRPAEWQRLRSGQPDHLHG